MERSLSSKVLSYRPFQLHAYLLELKRYNSDWKLSESTCDIQIRSHVITWKRPHDDLTGMYMGHIWYVCICSLHSFFYTVAYSVAVFELGHSASLWIVVLTLIDVVVFLGSIDNGHESDDGSFQGAYGWTMSLIYLVIMVFHYGDELTHGINYIERYAYKLYNSFDVMSKFINNINITAVSTKSLGTISRSFRFWPKLIQD